MIPKSLGFGRSTYGQAWVDRLMDRPTRGPVGLVAGTLVWTSDGALPVEYLVPGDRIVTRESGLVRLDALDQHAALTQMVRLPAHAFRPGQPGQTLELPAAQPLLARRDAAIRNNGVEPCLIEAATCLDWQIAEDLGRQSVNLYVLDLGGAHLVYCSGLEIGMFGR
ncbi:MAG: Hint domain-containing protein [Marinibacterium sp.]